MTRRSPIRVSKFVLALLLLFAVPAFAGEDSDVESQKVRYLIASIETLQNAQFIRNGKAYDEKQAADHLRLKLRRAGDRCQTADDFIRYCASASSMSAKPYQIRFANGEQVLTEKFLREKLAEFKPGAGDEQSKNE